jgi:hypothetical protein
MTKSRRKFLADSVALAGAAMTARLPAWPSAANQSALIDLTAVDAVTAMRNGDIKSEQPRLWTDA